MASTRSRKLSTSIFFDKSSLPHTSEEWEVALHQVKFLYTQRQYKQCASRAETLLSFSREPIHAVHKTYLYFYSAISYEALGRAAHKYSSNKLSLLHSALDCFTTCSAVLPSTITVSDYGRGTSMEDIDEYETSLVDDSTPGDSPDSSFLETEAESPSTVGGLVGSLTRIIDDSMAWDEDDPFISHEHEQVDQDVNVGLFRLPREESKGRLMPLPLQIRKPDAGSTCAERSYRPSPLPIKIVPFEAEHTGSGITESQEHSKYIKSITRYNNSIHFLRTQITTNITTIHTLITSITKLQRARKASRARNLRRVASFWSFSPVQLGEDTSDNGCLGRNPSAGASGSPSGSQSPEWGGAEEEQEQQESKAERIARLRAEGWKTVGVRNGRRGWKGAAYYEAYCNGVLDELYLGES
ncbi:uncharacterized protein ACHE_50798A [Aspergillus chevalieri]|uniref:Uncharacterized protein n=1 Tax=Aspergillus chevalieri TaxID=182096 RepID=A0A7R7ZP64_ASPCH|nr:uncharacterized protein ACHE_50798A [Aspergillus chevalieri]BCR89600.1 hypothetical protein ACHE_50798A [Aspergillus chevalieri]